MSGPVQKQPSKERIRGPYLETFITIEKRVPFEEALVRADAENRVIASNKRVDLVLEKGAEDLIAVRNGFSCWTGTIVAYTKNDHELGEVVACVDPYSNRRWVFPVPKEHQGKANCVLVTEHPDFELEPDGNDLVVNASHPIIVKSFPKYESIWADRGSRYYYCDRVFGIPIGDDVDPDRLVKRDDYDRVYPDARLLARSSEATVGPIFRNLGGTIFINGSDRDGVLVETPDLPARPDRYRWPADFDPIPAYDGRDMYLMRRFFGDERLREFAFELKTLRLGPVYGPAEYIVEGLSKLDMDIAWQRHFGILVEDVGKRIRGMIDYLIREFKSQGPDHPPLRFVKDLLGEFVVKTLPENGYPLELVKELKIYFVQKVKELKEVQK